MKTLKTVFAALLATTLLFTGCTTGGGASSTAPTGTDSATVSSEITADGKKVLHLNNSTEPGALHPSLAQGTHDSYPLNHLFEGLYEKDPEGGEPMLAAASKVETSDDGLTWTFTINPDEKWSNGDPVTAEDFVTSYEYALNPKNAAKYSGQFFVFVNGEAYNKGELPFEEVGIKAVGADKLELTLENPMSFLPDYLTHYTFYPVHTATQLANPDWYKSADNYFSNGAFKLTEWKNKESITLEKNENFRRAADVKIDRLHYVIVVDGATAWPMVENGELDAQYPLPPAVVDKLRTEKDARLQSFPDLATYYYYFNTEKPGLKNIKVRQALAMAIDRTSLVTNVTKGGQIPAYALTPPGIPDGNGDFQENLGPMFKEDLTGAKALLEEGLKEEGLTLDTWKFTLLYNTDDTHKKVAEAIQAMWKQNLGVNVELQNAEFQTVLDMRDKGDFDVCRAGWVGDYADPLTFMDLFVTGGEFNDGNWSNAEYDNLIKTAQTSGDNDVRMKAFADAEKILADEMGILPLYFYVKNWAISEKVTGYFAPANRYVMWLYADITA